MLRAPLLPEHTMNTTHPTLCEFLTDRKTRPIPQFVIGNRAGDADTIVSAVTLAYLESETTGTTQKTPIVAIPRADFATQRPEANLLFELAGIPDVADRLLFVDDAIVNQLYAVNVTLVDHNVLAHKFQRKGWTVQEIVDHHRDEGMHLDTCSGSARNVAFAHGKALVASACTLVAERWKRAWEKPYPGSIGVLLLGVILLDSVNLSPDAGKVTRRDRKAVQDLLQHTEWHDFTPELQSVLQITPISGPNITSFFDLLQSAKYDKDFWSSLSIRDALRLDFKSFEYRNGDFGVSTVLMPLRDFLAKSNLAKGVKLFMEAHEQQFLAIMFASERKGKNLERQLALCGIPSFPMDALAAFLLNEEYDQASLALEELEQTSLSPSESGLSLRLFEQHNVAPSRKQIGPILLQFFETQQVSPANPRPCCSEIESSN